MNKPDEQIIAKHLSGFVQSFIVDEKKERYQYLVESSARRKKWLKELDHFEKNLRLDLATSTKKVKCLADMHELNVKFNPDQEVFVFSNYAVLNEQLTPFRCAFDTVFLGLIGSIISVEPGKLAIYVGEYAEERYLFELKM